MKTYRILWNPYACSGRGEQNAHALDTLLAGNQLVYQDMTEIQSYAELDHASSPEETWVLCGGDGTLNHFLRDTDGLQLQREILYYASGSGNDFLRDTGKREGEAPFSLLPYISHLPTVTVNGKTCRFLNGIGFGIDGYCCAVGDKQRENSDKPVNYTVIAIKGLLFHYKPTDAVVTVDGVEHRYKKVWLAPTMYGRFYGGGMMPTPQQDRLSPAGTVSVMVYYGAGKLKSLAVFPSIFKGEHIRHTEMVEIHVGHTVKVAFSRPTDLQIDGETICGVKEYTVHAAAPAPVRNPEREDSPAAVSV